jgi:ubiquinone/menaquinone biosynthesis C-methylase UbiE
MQDSATGAGLLGEISGWRPEALAAEPDYRPFPNVERRNAWQERAEIPLLIAALGLGRGGRVLEIGCGRGVALAPLARRLAPTRLAGLDVDAGLLAQARVRVANCAIDVELALGDVRALPFPDASFDVVVDFGTCYHVSRRARALAEIARVLVEGGRLVHETRLSQWLSHPVRSWWRRLPWQAVPELARECYALLWATRIKRGGH